MTHLQERTSSGGLETIVYLALLRKYRMKGFDIYYYSVRTWECNFIICDGRKTILAVQVSYDISSQKTKNREIVGLLKTAKKTGCQNLLLLTDHNEENIEQDGYIISVRPVYDYLLE